MEFADIVKRVIAALIFLVVLWIAYHVAKFLIGILLVAAVVVIGYIVLKRKGILP